MAGVEGRSFGQLGGDSLAAIQFARYVSELCGINLPVSFVLDHSHSLQAIIDRVSSLVRWVQAHDMCLSSWISAV